MRDPADNEFGLRSELRQKTEHNKNPLEAEKSSISERRYGFLEPVEDKFRDIISSYGATLFKYFVDIYNTDDKFNEIIRTCISKINHTLVHFEDTNNQEHLSLDEISKLVKNHISKSVENIETKFPQHSSVSEQDLNQLLDDIETIIKRKND